MNLPVVVKLLLNGCFILLPVFFTTVAVAMPPAEQMEEQSAADSVVTVTAGKKYQRSGFHRFWFGKHYRRVWAEPVQVPVFKNPGGKPDLIPLKMGGSYQTKNLRLSDAGGREYVLRSIDKDPSGALPGWLQKTFVANLMRDQTSVIHPYGAFIVPTLAAAAGIYHTNPTLVYVGKNTNLGEFSEEFSEMLVLMEERPDGNRKEVASFGHSENIMSSAKAFEEMYSDNCHQVDAKFYLRSRLFDMLIGDWSRREDQWRWATFTDGDKTIYRAIPRDRDHAFFLFNDGVLTRLISWFKPTYQTFSENFKNIKGLNHTGRPTDDYFFAMLTEADFVAEAEYLKMQLTDQVIKDAVAVWPENIYRLSGEEFIRKLTSRRDQLPEVARQYYKILNRKILIPGTDKAEKFTIERPDPESVKITISYLKDNCSEDSVLAEKTFNRKYTKRISVYGLNGKDEFVITGQGRKKIWIRIYPGAGADNIQVKSYAKGRKARTRIYTSDDGDELELKTRPSVKDKNNIKAKDYDATGWLLRHRLH